MKFGTTFSSRYIHTVGIPLTEALNELLDFSFDIVRIGSYWDEFEKEQGLYEYNDLEYIIEACQERNQRIILTVGMKSPRWPEFYIPSWVSETGEEKEKQKNVVSLAPYALDAIHHTIQAFKKFTCIVAWQVENEPLDPSGPDNLTVPVSLLEQEVSVVRSLDSRPIIINLWGNELTKRNLLPKVAEIADIVGVDLYYKVPTKFFGYQGPSDSDTRIQDELQKCHKPVYITELQAEPWENDPQRIETPSMNERIFEDNVQRVLTYISCESILLWGFEYWLQNKLTGDKRLWNTAKKLIYRNRVYYVNMIICLSNDMPAVLVENKGFVVLEL